MPVQLQKKLGSWEEVRAYLRRLYGDGSQSVATINRWCRAAEGIPEVVVAEMQHIKYLKVAL